MNKLIYFCIECNKGRKEIDKKSDELYINKLIETYFNNNDTKHQFAYMGGKTKYKNSYKDALKVCKGFEKDKVIQSYKIILVLDKDNFASDNRDNEFVEEINQFANKKDIDVIWFTKDIEHVLLGKRLSKGKTKSARNYQVSTDNKESLRKRLSSMSPNAERTSNFIVVLNKYYN